MMFQKIRYAAATAALLLLSPLVLAQGSGNFVPEWVQRSNEIAYKILESGAKFAPEFAGQTGVSGYDEEIFDLGPKLFERQMFKQFGYILGLTLKENACAVAAGYRALDRFVNQVQRDRAREIIANLELEDRLGIVMLGRPYHNDPGINHEILEEFQKLGYPILTQASLPLDEEMLERLFGDEVRSGVVDHPLSITDVWKNSYSENTSQKVFAAKYVARHPNLVALELSNFKCGHDAPIYSVVEEIIEASGTPCFSFKDIDENKPSGSIKIRVETIGYFLKTYREDLMAGRIKRSEIDKRMRELEADLRRRVAAEGAAALVDNRLPVVRSA